VIVKCSHCRQILSAEDFNSHKCELSLVGNREIPVVYFIETSYSNKKSVTAWGVDGILYTFEVVPRKPIPIIENMSRRKVTDFRTDGEVTEPSQTAFEVGDASDRQVLIMGLLKAPRMQGRARRSHIT
jgi:hypothetical protein